MNENLAGSGGEQRFQLSEEDGTIYYADRRLPGIDDSETEPEIPDTEWPAGEFRPNEK